MNYRLILGVAIMAALLLAGCPTTKSSTTSTSGSGSTTVGGGKATVNSPQAKLQITTYDGKQKTLGDYMGKPLVVNYFAMF